MASLLSAALEFKENGRDKKDCRQYFLWILEIKENPRKLGRCRHCSLLFWNSKRIE
jgi:hypothetical protein